MSAGDPWWFSGTAPDDESEDAPGQSARGGFSLSFLAAGAQQFVDMAKQATVGWRRDVQHRGRRRRHENPRRSRR